MAVPGIIKLTIIIPTFNRASSLEKTLSSVTSAPIPPDLEVEVIVVDNNSTDNTRAIVERMRPEFHVIKLDYEFEPRQGRSYAVNTGIRKASGDLISMIDDDEQIDTSWFAELRNIFKSRWEELDFASGKILPILESEPPPWIGPIKHGPLVWRDFGDEEWKFDRNTPIVLGAHGIFKKSVFDKTGLYSESLGVKGKGMLGGEDEVFYDQLMENNFRGLYHPKLIVHHNLPARRMTESYYRNWLIGVGRSRRIADVNYKKIDGPRIFGVPRWMFRSAGQGILKRAKYTFRRNKEEALVAENQPLVLLGFLYETFLSGRPIGRLLKRSAQLFTREIER